MVRSEFDTNTIDGGLRPWIISLTFWTCLLVATLLYAVVALAPKYLVYLRLKDAHFANQVRLVNLEQQNGYLQKVVYALEDEPRFQAELARYDFDAAKPDEERIAVEGALALDRLTAPAFVVPDETLPPYLPIVEAWPPTIRCGASC